MKRNKKLLSLISALAIPLMLSGCVNKKSEEKKLAKALEERYGEEFVVVDSIVTGGNWLTAGPLSAVCYPKSDRDLLFKADYSIANQYIYDDGYIQAIVREEIINNMENVLSQYYDTFVVEVDVCQKHTSLTNKEDVSVKSYSEIIPDENSVVINIAILDSEVLHCSDIETVLGECSKQFHLINAKIYCNFVSLNIIEKCKELQSDNIFDLDEIFWLLQNEKPFSVYSYYNGNNYNIEYLGDIN